MIQLVEKDENTTRTYVQQLKQRCDEKDRKVDAIVADIFGKCTQQRRQSRC